VSRNSLVLIAKKQQNAILRRRSQAVYRPRRRNVWRFSRKPLSATHV